MGPRRWWLQAIAFGCAVALGLGSAVGSAAPLGQDDEDEPEITAEVDAGEMLDGVTPGDLFRVVDDLVDESPLGSPDTPLTNVPGPSDAFQNTPWSGGTE
jgi:hypothetical protein